MARTFPLAEVDASAVFPQEVRSQMVHRPSVLLDGQKQQQRVLLDDLSWRKRTSSSRKTPDTEESGEMQLDNEDIPPLIGVTTPTMELGEEPQHTYSSGRVTPPAKKRLVAVTDSDPSMAAAPTAAPAFFPLPLPSPSASPSHDDSEGTSATTVQDTMQLIRTIPPGSVQSNELLWTLLQRTDANVLSALMRTLRTALRKDVIQNLPSEIVYKIFERFDYQTLLNSSEVCRGWLGIYTQLASEMWKRLLFRDNLVASEQEYQRAFALASSRRPELNEAEINKILYRRRIMIGRRWKDPDFQPRRMTLPGQGPNVITCLQFDDDKIAAGSDDSTITIYDTKTGKLRSVLEGHSGGVWAMKFYKNTLASGSTDRTVRIWNIAQARCTYVFKGHVSTVRCLDIIEPRQIGTDDEGKPIVFPETPLLVTGSRDTTLFVWRLPLADEDDILQDRPIEFDEGDNRYLVRVLKGHTDSVRAVTGYANILISASYDHTARVWDLRTGECKYVLSGHANRIYSCVYDVERCQCYTGSVDNTVRIWDLAKGTCKSVLEGHQSLVGLITSSKHALVSAAADWTVRIWDPDTGMPRHVLRGHGSAITCVQNNDYVIVSGSDNMLKVWDTHTGEYIRDLLEDVDGSVWQVKFDYRRCVAAVRNNNRTCIEIFDFCPPDTDYLVG